MGSKQSNIQVLNKLKLKHSDKYQYLPFEYNNEYDKIHIICPIHGEFQQTIKSHLKGYGCVACGQSNRKDNKLFTSTEEFIELSKKTHHNKYNYLKTKCSSSKDVVTITCPKHGDFNMKAINHIRKNGCRKCGIESSIKIKTLTHENFMNRVKGLNYDFDYSNTKYVDSSTKIKVICKLHGEFEQAPFSHLAGNGCNKCADLRRGDKIKYKHEEALDKIIKVHNGVYDYSKFIYNGFHNKSIFICKKHGEFEQAYVNHLSGSGCIKCNREILYSTYVKDGWIQRSKGRSGKLYILRCFNDDEIFFKVGITFNSVKERYGNNKREMPYNYEVVYLEENNDLSYIYDKELKIKSAIKDKLYLPKIKFAGGKRECVKNLDLISHLICK